MVSGYDSQNLIGWRRHAARGTAAWLEAAAASNKNWLGRLGAGGVLCGYLASIRGSAAIHKETVHAAVLAQITPPQAGLHREQHLPHSSLIRRDFCSKQSPPQACCHPHAPACARHQPPTCAGMAAAAGSFQVVLVGSPRQAVDSSLLPPVCLRYLQGLLVTALMLYSALGGIHCFHPAAAPGVAALVPVLLPPSPCLPRRGLLLLHSLHGRTAGVLLPAQRCVAMIGRLLCLASWMLLHACRDPRHRRWPFALCAAPASAAATAATCPAAAAFAAASAAASAAATAAVSHALKSSAAQPLHVLAADRHRTPPPSR